MDLLPIRLSHLLSHSGVGAIVRGPQGLVIVQDIRNWTDRSGHPAGKVIPYVERVRSALGIFQELREPPIAKELANGQVDGVCVPVSRFPFWMRCPNRLCGRLYKRPWKDQETDEPCCLICANHPKLEQVTWVLADPRGHLSDVDWRYLTHQHARTPEQQQCRVRDELSLVDQGYERRTLKCKACKAIQTFDGSERIGFGNSKVQPWSRDSANALPDGAQAEPAQVLQINDARLYAALADSVLVIPPESRVRRGTVVDLLYRNTQDRARMDNARNTLARNRELRILAAKYRCELDEIESALTQIGNGYPLYGTSFTPGLLHEGEFQAFLDARADQRSDEDLVTVDRTEAWRALSRDDRFDAKLRARIGGIQSLVRVDRLKAIKVFRGFKRLGGDPVPADLTGTSDWLPAIQLYGEGIFLTLDEDRLAVWESNEDVLRRLDCLRPRFAQSGRDAPNPLTTRFMLLHTLAHLLIRQMEFEGGYPAASLSERIYCSTSPTPMAGILVWVAVPDIAGSLGGLAELAEPNRFLGIFSRSLEHAHWCSLDPVCSEHEGQGPGLLNRAACHACALVPEPACDFGNTLLDRCFVKGDEASGLPSYFGMELP